MTANSEAREAREQSIIQDADYFTVVRYLGPGKGYERHERVLLRDARTLGKQLAEENKANYIIYAVKGIHDTYCEGVKFQPQRTTNDGAKTKVRRPRIRLT